LINWMATFAALWRVVLDARRPRRVAARRHIMKLYSNNNAVRVIKVLVQKSRRLCRSSCKHTSRAPPLRFCCCCWRLYGRAREAVTINNAPVRLLLYNKFYVACPTSGAYCEIPFWALGVCVGDYTSPFSHLCARTRQKGCCLILRNN
jgi:hypothetical protein